MTTHRHSGADGHYLDHRPTLMWVHRCSSGTREPLQTQRTYNPHAAGSNEPSAFQGREEPRVKPSRADGAPTPYACDGFTLGTILRGLMPPAPPSNASPSGYNARYARVKPRRLRFGAPAFKINAREARIKLKRFRFYAPAAICKQTPDASTPRPLFACRAAFAIGALSASTAQRRFAPLVAVLAGRPSLSARFARRSSRWGVCVMLATLTLNKHPTARAARPFLR